MNFFKIQLGESKNSNLTINNISIQEKIKQFKIGNLNELNLKNIEFGNIN